MERYGSRLKAGIEQTGILPFIGVYDTFSAGIAGQHFDNIFISGFSFATQSAVDRAISGLKDANGLLSKQISGGVSLDDAVARLEANLEAKDRRA